MSHHELPADLRRNLQAHGANPDNVRMLMGRRQPISGLDPEPMKKRSSGDYSEQPGIRRIHADDEHRLHPFMKQLLHEQRRTERTKIPLSIVLIRIECAGEPDLGKIEQLYEMICRISRETDIPARFGVDLIAILLLDTNGDGARVFTERILVRTNEFTVSAIAQTYPDHLFDNLLSGNGDPTDPDSLVLDDSAMRGRPQFIPAALLAAKESWGDIKGFVNRSGFG